MKNIQKIVYILFSVFACMSCITPELESVSPNSIIVKQGGIAIQNQNTVIEYGTLRASKDSVTKYYVLQNTGSQILNFSKITSDSPDFFVEMEKDTIALFPNDGLNFSVTFAPKSGGKTIGKISFSSNDPAFPIFSFNVKGEGIAPPEIIGNNSPQFEELNTVDFGGGIKGTRFMIELYIEDTYDRINPASLSAEMKFNFNNGNPATFLTKRPSEITVSPDKSKISYSFVLHFGTSNFVDVDTQLVLGNGDISEPFRTRIERPNGAD